MAIDDGDTLIATAGGDGTLKVREVETLLQVARNPTGEVATQPAFDRDRILASGDP